MAISDRARFGVVVLLAAFLTGYAAVTAVGQTYGTFLPPAGPNTIVHTYGNVSGANPPAPVQVFGPNGHPIRDAAKSIDAGVLRFDYDTYTRNPNGNTAAGAALAGGFYMDNAVRVKTGFTLAFVQTVTATITGQNFWNLPAMNAGRFPDAPANNPTYPIQTLPVAPPNPPGAPFLAFQDGPSRGFAGGNQSWLAELALACISTTPGADGFRNVRVIGSFTWGFDFINLPAANPGIANVQAAMPGAFGNASAGFIQTLNGFYDGMGGGNPNANPPVPPVASNRFRFANNSNCFAPIPEPASLSLALAGLLLMRRRTTPKRRPRTGDWRELQRPVERTPAI